MTARLDRKAAGEPFPRKSAIHEHVRQMLSIERLCNRFHLVAGQLQKRHAGRQTLRVEDEHDLQDLLQALLLLEHDEVRPVEWAPPYGGCIVRTDFLLPFEKIMVAARMTGDDFREQELREQLLVDVSEYIKKPECRTLVWFVYDPGGRVENPRRVESDLNGEQEGLEVRVIIAPKAFSVR